jgi:hypothetical protein
MTALMALVLLVFLVRRSTKGEEFDFFTIILILMFSTLVVVLWMFVSGAIGTISWPKEVINKEYKVYNLETLRPKDALDGSFLFGSGHINSIPKFQFLVKWGDGYSIKTIDAEGVKIVFTDDREPMLCYSKSYAPGESWILTILIYPLKGDSFIDRFDPRDRVVYLPSNSKPTGFLVQPEID